MSIDINYLPVQPYNPIWHPTCNRRKRRHAFGRPVAKASRHRLPGSAIPLAFFTFQGTQSKFHARSSVPG
jgi:hypothetical protein